MPFSEWKDLPPARAAHELCRRVQALSPPQRKAIVASLPSEIDLAARFAAAPRGLPLSGVPFFAKDLFDAAGELTRAGSGFLAEVRPAAAADSAMIRALKAAGAVLAGKAHLHEFAYGLTGDNPFYGDCDNPRFPGRTTGGSSSGSAAIVAAGVAPLATGTDTGGSIRVPAAYCGLYGFRMTPRHPWIADAFPLAPGFDTAGWFTETGEDMCLAIRALVPAASKASATASRGCYLEMPGLDPEVAAALAGAAAKFAPKADPATASELLAAFSDATDAYTVLTTLEALDIHRPWLDSRRDRYSPEVWARIDRGRHWPAAKIEAAKAGFEKINRAWDRFFATFDFLAMAAAPSPAPVLGQYPADGRTRILDLSAPASVGGRPALTVPVGLPSGLGAGLQIVFRDVESVAPDLIV